MGKNGRYTDDDFWHKLNTYAKKAGRKVVETALQLYYAANDKKTPKWARGVIYSALVYLITPVDLIPDMTPFAGFADDLGVLVGAVSAVAGHITDKAKGQAQKKLSDWFG